MNKRTFFFAVVLILAAFGGIKAAAQNDPQRTFGRANDQLQKGNINQALDLYHQLESQNQVSGALFLNMGLTYLRVDSMGQAKYYFMKAEKFKETRSRAQKGLQYVENKFSHQSAVLPKLPWQQALNWLAGHLGVTILLGIGLLIFNFGIFLYIIPWLSGRSHKLLPPTALTMMVIGVLVVALSFYINYREHRYHKAVMITQQAKVREKPGTSADLVSNAYDGYVFTVDRNKSKKHAGWSYVRMSNGEYGWIQSKEIKIL